MTDKKLIMFIPVAFLSIAIVYFGGFFEYYTETVLQEEMEEGCKIRVYPNNTVWCEIEKEELKNPEKGIWGFVIGIGWVFFWAWFILFRGN